MILNRATLLGLLSTLLLLLTLLPSLLRMIDVSNIPAIFPSMQDGNPSPNSSPSEDTNEPTSGKHQGQLTDNTTPVPQVGGKISRGDTGVRPVSKLHIKSLTQQSKTPRMNLTDLQKSDSGLPAENTLAKFNLQTIQQEVKKFIRRKILSRRKLAGSNLE
ncbi:hypothetical protein [Serratia liquefaciens]|uniref:hypothetical protein n=1 Tax=Serratia liquefaciens TaxID=614 RepID=UPI00218428A2|nr:hypothetical protein [Serratia liquefaciens]CAI2413623.1 Uncharacterised protein [Serratia liquefaciens]